LVSLYILFIVHDAITHACWDRERVACFLSLLFFFFVFLLSWRLTFSTPLSNDQFHFATQTLLPSVQIFLLTSPYIAYGHNWSMTSQSIGQAHLHSILGWYIYTVHSILVINLILWLVSNKIYHLMHQVLNYVHHFKVGF
jgi:hypothetical protein